MDTIPVKHYSKHRCEKSHKSAETFLKCAMKWAKNGSGNWQTMTHDFKGSGNWAVVHRSHSESSREHNGNYRDTSYYSLQIFLCPTQEKASDVWAQISSFHNGSQRCSGGCAGLDQHLIEVCL
jgi:hypothetical protein